MPPRDLDDILDDADDARAPTWKKVGDFEVLESSLGTAILCHLAYESGYDAMRSGEVRALVRYPDRVAVDIGDGPHAVLKQRCESALRERPRTMKTLDLDDEPSRAQPVDPLEEASDVDPFASTERTKPPARVWRTVPISSGDED